MSPPEPPRRPYRRTRREAWDGPRPMSGSVDRLMKHMKAPEVSIIESVFSRWPELVGDVIGSHTRPVRIEEGALLIEVDDPAWASEMEWMGEELVRQIRTKLETDQVRGLKVRIARAS